MYHLVQEMYANEVDKFWCTKICMKLFFVVLIAFNVKVHFLNSTMIFLLGLLYDFDFGVKGKGNNVPLKWS